MATLRQSNSFSAKQLVARVFQHYAGLVAHMTSLFGAKHISATRIGPMAAERAGQLFAQALQEDSHWELDWLWYASKMTNSAHRRYCLRRALAINPASEMARRTLAKLALHEHR